VIPVKIDSTIRRKVCLIIKDPSQIWIDLNINFDDHPELDVMVIPFSQLKLEYAMYEQKRNLLKQFDAFICDTTIYMHLKKVLGREFYDAKKYPINVKINSQIEPSKIKNEILEASSNYLFYMSKGPNYSVKAGFAVEKEAELVKKIQTAVTYTVAHILKWDVELDNLKTISLKLSNSIELPIFNSLTKEEIVIAKQVAKEGITPRTTKDKTDRTKIDLTQRNKKHSEKKTKAPEKVKSDSKKNKSNKK
jgi:ribosome biogenesis protein UTP30